MADQKFNILFLEDNLVSSNFFITTLSRDLPDVKLVPAISIKEARQKVLEQPFDLFILDIQLPDGNSIDFLVELQRKHVVVPRAIFMTASKVPEFRDRAHSAGAVRFFEKPVKTREFIQVIQDILKEKPLQESETAFEGVLTSLTPLDLVQLKCLTQANVGLEFTTKEGRVGAIFFCNGQVVHATTVELTGEDAFCRIMSWKQGKIREIPLQTNQPRSIQSNWTDLVMTAAQKIDETATP